jgi:DNA-binding MarR family transcriptional regulator
MTADQFVLLMVLAEDGQATQQELVRRCSSDTATIGTMLSLLESKGIVDRVRHPEDGRARNVRLTRAGRRLAAEMRRCSTGIRSELAGLFNKQEMRSLIEFLDRIVGAMRPVMRRRAVLPRRGLRSRVK